MAKVKRKPGEIPAEQKGAFCTEVAEVYEKTLRDWEWLEGELIKGEKMDFQAVDGVLDLAEERLWRLEAKKYGVDWEDFKKDAPLYRRGFTKWDIEGHYKPFLGVNDMILSLMYESYYTLPALKSFDRSRSLIERIVSQMLFDNLKPEQLRLIKAMSSPTILITPVGSLASKIKTLNQNKLGNRQEDVCLPTTTEFVNYQQVKDRQKYLLSVVDRIEIARLLDENKIIYNKYYAQLVKNEPRELARKYQYYQDKYRKCGAEIMGVHEYLVLMQWYVLKNRDEFEDESERCINMPDFSKDRNSNTVFNRDDFPVDTNGYPFGRFDFNEERGKYRILLNSYKAGRPEKGIYFRPSVRICEF